MLFFFILFLLAKKYNQHHLSVFDLFEGHYAVDRRSGRHIILLACSNLHSFLPSPDIEVLRPIGLQVQLNFTPLKYMNSWKHLGRLPYHYVKLAPFLVDLGGLESVEVRFVSRNELIAYRAEVMVISMINKSNVGVIETFHQGLLSTFLGLMERAFRVGLIKQVGPAAASVNSTK